MRWARRATEEEELGAVVVFGFDPLRSSTEMEEFSGGAANHRLNCRGR